MQSGVKLIIGLCILAFATMLSYAVAGSAAQSLFLSAFGAERLPYAWLGVAAMSVIVTGWLNALSETHDIVRLFGVGCRMSGLSLLAILLLGTQAPNVAAFALYVWKDIYIIVLVELFWTFANIVFGVNSASRAYGFFCAAGSLGGVVGSLLLARSAHWVGTRQSLWSLLPLLVVIAWGCRRLARHTPIPAPQKRAGVGLAHGFAALRQSAILPSMLLLVASAQAWLTLLDFRYSAAIELASVGAEERTSIISNVNALINAISFALQMATGAVLSTFGGAATLGLLPAAAAASLAWVTQAPQSLMAVAGAQVCGKSLDYSLFRASKEMIYIPLSYAEKTQGKAIIDILVYRAAKGAVSATLLTLASLGLAQEYTLRLLWAVGLCWALSVALLLRRMHAHPGLRASFFASMGRRHTGGRGGVS